MVERVSSHFYYDEEYVLDHSFPWLKRKFGQADRELYDRRRLQSEETTRGVMAAISGLFGGENSQIENILLPDYDDFKQNKQSANNDKYVSGEWWKNKSS